MLYKIISFLVDLCDKIYDELCIKKYELSKKEDRRKEKKKDKKRKKQTQKIKKAKNLLGSEGYVFERGWEKIRYKDKLYDTIMVEEYEHSDRDSITITAICKKYKEQG